MAARRSSRSRSNGGSRRGSRGSARSSGNPVPAILGIGVVVVVILVAFASMGKGEDPRPAQPAARLPDPTPAAKPVSAPKRARPAAGSSTVLKDPDRPAPAIPTGVLGKADELYGKAKKLHDDARRALGRGDNTEFNRLINDSWDTLMRLNSHLETYTDWLAEADFEDWRVPAEYDGLKRRINTYDALKGRVRKIKPNRRAP